MFVKPMTLSIVWKSGPLPSDLHVFVTHFGSRLVKAQGKKHVSSEGNNLGEPEIVCYDDTRQDFQPASFL